MRIKSSVVVTGALAILCCAVGVSVAGTSLGPAATTGPAPTKPLARGALSECPNPAGLQPFDATASRRAATDVLDYGHVSVALDLDDSDRAWQPDVRAMWKGIHQSEPPEQRTRIAMNATPARRSSYRSIVAHSCGYALIRRSLTVTAGPETSPQCPRV